MPLNITTIETTAVHSFELYLPGQEWCDKILRNPCSFSGDPTDPAGLGRHENRPLQASKHMKSHNSDFTKLDICDNTRKGWACVSFHYL